MTKFFWNSSSEDACCLEDGKNTAACIKAEKRNTPDCRSGVSRVRTVLVCIFVFILAMTLLCACDGTNKVTGSTKPPVILSTHGNGETGNSAGRDEIPGTPDTATAEPTDRPVFSETFTFTGGAYCILDTDGGIVLERNADEQMYIASITKLLTALVAVDYFGIEESITVEKGYLDLIRANPDIDAYGMKEGQTYLVEDLLKMLLLRSYGDAALALQYGTEERTGRKFLDLMNEKAAELGMAKSHFDNPIGLDTGNNFAENYSSAWDAAKLMLAAYRNETVFSVCSLRSAELSFGAKLTNSNALMGDAYASDHYKVLAGKTGSTKAAGYNLACVAQGSEHGETYIFVYLHGTSSGVLNNELSGMIASLFE